MKTLLDRATPELLSKLELFEEAYPLTGEFVREALAKYHFVLDLPYGTIIDLQNVINDRFRSIFELFGPIN
jgi:hypothetical protein